MTRTRKFAPVVRRVEVWEKADPKRCSYSVRCGKPDCMTLHRCALPVGHSGPCSLRKGE